MLMSMCLSCFKWTAVPQELFSGENNTEQKKTVEGAVSLYLHGWDVSMGHVSVHILDLGQVLLCYLDQLRTPRLLCELRGALVLGGRVLIMVPVLLQQETHKHKNTVKQSCWTLSNRQRALPCFTFILPLQNKPVWNTLCYRRHFKFFILSVKCGKNFNFKK